MVLPLMALRRFCAPCWPIQRPAMTIGTNTSPLVGKVKGHKVTARMVKDRLDRELLGELVATATDAYGGVNVLSNNVGVIL